jgi:predicted RecA/RadA family phage recombinase
MALNYRGGSAHPKSTVVTAAAARSSGAAVVEQGIAGVAATSAASGVKYALWHSQGEFELPFITGAVKGWRVLINTTTMALTAQAPGGTVTAPNVLFGVVTAVPGDGPDSSDMGYTPNEPLAGLMWVELQPQAL